MAEQILFQIVVRVPKEQSAYLYFQLEANEGLCFYSTLEHLPGDTHRDIDMKCTLDYRNDLLHLIKKLGENCAIEILHKGEWSKKRDDE